METVLVSIYIILPHLPLIHLSTHLFSAHSREDRLPAKSLHQPDT